MELIDTFKNKARIWAKDLKKLESIPAKGALRTRKNALLRTGQLIRRSVEAVFGTLDTLETNGMGLVPLIPVAAIGIAIAAMYKWTLDYWEFGKLFDEQLRLEQAGMDPLAASTIIAKKSDQPWINFDTKTMLPIALIAGGGLFLFSKRAR